MSIISFFSVYINQHVLSGLIVIGHPVYATAIEHRGHLRGDLYHHVCAYRITYDNPASPTGEAGAGVLHFERTPYCFYRVTAAAGRRLILLIQQPAISKLVSFRIENKSPLQTSTCS